LHEFVQLAAADGEEVVPQTAALRAYGGQRQVKPFEDAAFQVEDD
jgi:hypothetical protein